MPAQNRPGRYESMAVHADRKQRAQRGEPGPVGPVQAGFRVRPAQDRDLVAQDQQFGVLQCG